MSYPKTVRFSIVRSDTRAPHDPVLNIMYGGQLFGHTWIMKDWAPEYDGKWTFNRADVAIAHRYWPPQYHHDTLEALLIHLEETFQERTASGAPFPNS